MSFVMRVIHETNEDFGVMSKAIGYQEDYVRQGLGRNADFRFRIKIAKYLDKPKEWCYNYTKQELEKMNECIVRDIAIKYFGGEE